MPFPANWLEELVVEWLEFQGFTISTSVSIPAGPGGRRVPDVVGAKLDGGKLIIRHYEATMWLIQGPENVGKKFQDKFSRAVETAVRNHFAPIFGASAVEAEYQKWIITFQASNRVKQALSEAIPGVHLHLFEAFVEEVLQSIGEWRSAHAKASIALPADKWIMQQLDVLNWSGLIKRS